MTYSKLVYELTDLQIDLMRVDAGLRIKAIRKLQSKKRALESLIYAHTGKSERSIKQTIKSINNLLEELYKGLNEDAEQDYPELYSVASQATYDVYNKHVDISEPEDSDKYLLLLASIPFATWLSKNRADYSFKLEQALRRKVFEGLDDNELKLILDGASQQTKQSIDTLIRTAVATVAIDAVQNLAKANQKQIKAYQHISILDNKTSIICLNRAFKTWDKNKQPIEHDFTFKYPPLHPNCRSSILVLFSDDKVEQLDIHDWLNSKTENEQDVILGKGKAQLWRSGKITLRDMLDQTGRPLTLEQLKEHYALNDIRSAIDKAYDKYQRAEVKITRDMQSIAHHVGVELGGLEYRLKSKESLTRKMYEKHIVNRYDLAWSVNKNNDIIRYTALLDARDFVTQYDEIQKLLQDNGYQTVIVKNTWQENKPYKGINTILRKNNLQFEMQYHTQQSFDLKNGELHQLYGKARLPEISNEEWNNLTQQMITLSNQIPIIKDIERIK